MDELKIDDSSLTKKRKRNLKSSVWTEFDLIKQNGKEKAKCKHCGTEYVHDSKRSGTSTLQRHVRKCLRLGKLEADVGQLLLPQVSWNCNMTTTSVEKLDQAVFCEKVAMAIVRHNYPFNIVEHEGFRDVCSYLNVNVKHLSRETAQEDVFELHRKQKELIRERLASTRGKICLTLDLWTSVAKDGYICLTAHFIDQDWVLQKLVLNFFSIPAQQSKNTIEDQVILMLGDWGVEGKIFFITSDNAITDGKCVEGWLDQLSPKGVSYSARPYFHVHCCAHTLNLMVKEGLATVNVAVEKIRESVKYFKGSEVTKAMFVDTVKKMELTPKRGLCQDVPGRWKSTFTMLESSIICQEVFEQFKLVDKNYQDCPTSEQWEQIAAFSKLLKAFYDVVRMFSGSRNPTTNVYFQGIWKIQMILKKERNSSNDFIRLMADRMQIQFNKYWSDFSTILAIAVIMDPRRKLSFVEFCYQKLYPETYRLEVKNVRDRTDSLYHEYSLCKPIENTSNKVANMGSVVEGNSTFDVDEIGEDLQEFASFQSSDNHMSELDFYILEPPNPINQELDILHFWKAQEYRYPNLSRMARDILTIPISTVNSESAFSIEGRVLDQYYSSLTPEIAEALVTTRDWLYGVGVDYLEVKTDEIVEDISGIETPSSSSNASNISGFSILP